jgi:hypothetical protein
MNNKNKLLVKEIDKALKQQDFNSLLSLFKENSFTYIDLLIFYKRKTNNASGIKTPLKCNRFWKSQLPDYYLDEIIVSDISHTFYEEYFSSNANCNHELNQHLLQISFDNFIKFFKFTRAYKYPDFINSLKCLIPSNKHLDKSIMEFDTILNLEDKILTEEMSDNNNILVYSLGEVFLAFSLLYYEFKQSPVNAENKSYQTQIEMALVEEINRIIHLFQADKNVDFYFKSNYELQKEYELYRAPHHILGKNSLTAPLSEKYRNLFELINRIIKRQEHSTIVEMYLMGYADIENIESSPITIKTNETYRIFQINNSKSPVEEYYFMNFSYDDLEKKTPKVTDTSSIINNLSFLGIPLIIKNEDNDKIT